MEAIIDVWVLREPSWSGAAIVGCEVMALDGKAGSVDEATLDLRTARIVVDTGPWIFGRKVIVPAGLLTGIDVDAGKVWVEATKEQIKNAPEYDPRNLTNDERHLQAVARYYGAPQPGGP